MNLSKLEEVYGKLEKETEHFLYFSGKGQYLAVVPKKVFWKTDDNNNSSMANSYTCGEPNRIYNRNRNDEKKEVR